jgi:hypothetical protein
MVLVDTQRISDAGYEDAGDELGRLLGDATG